MATNKRDIVRKERRKLRVRSSLCFGTQARLRVSVFRSLKHFYAQAIDDVSGMTLASSSTLQLSDIEQKKSDAARQVGLALAKLISQKGVGKVFLDRGSSRYIGRVAAFADGLREGGIEL
jgi:large subunit ribosomal protein L18